MNSFFQKALLEPETTLINLIRDAVRIEFSAIRTSLVERPEVKEEYLPRKEAAKLLQISLTQLYYLQKKSMLSYYRIGSKVYFKKSDLLNSFKPSQVRKNGKGGNSCN